MAMVNKDCIKVTEDLREPCLGEFLTPQQHTAMFTDIGILSTCIEDRNSKPVTRAVYKARLPDCLDLD